METICKNCGFKNKYKKDDIKYIPTTMPIAYIICKYCKKNIPLYIEI